VLGYAVGKMVVRNQNKRLQIVPSVTADSLSLSLSYEIK